MNIKGKGGLPDQYPINLTINIGYTVQNLGCDSMPEPYTVNTPRVDDDFAEQYLMILGDIPSLHPNLSDDEIEAVDWALKKLEGSR